MLELKPEQRKRHRKKIYIQIFYVSFGNGKKEHFKAADFELLRTLALHKS